MASLNSQCGFQPDRSTTDMIFMVRQVQEKCLEQNMNLYSVFIYLTKALDKVNRNTLWTIFRRPGYPLKITKLIQLFHNDMRGEVLSDWEPSEKFNISNGWKTRLHPCSSIIQPVLHPSATVCFQRCRPWYIHQISSIWLIV